MSTAPLPGPPQSSTPSDPSSSSSSLSWEGDKMFNIYIYDYCHKRGFKRTAKELLAEAEIPPDSTPPINARQGLLFEWWSVFWVLFTAKANGSGPDDAMVYTQHQAAQARQRQAQMATGTGQQIPGAQPGAIPQQPHMRSINGIPTNPNQPRFGGPNGPIPNGVVPPGQQGFPPGQPPPQMNGIPGPGGPPSTQNFTMIPGARGAMPPGARVPVNGAAPPFHHPSPSAMDPSSQNPGGQPNPQTPQQQPGQPLMTRMLPPNGMHPGMNQGQVPNPNSAYPMGRPPSRAATPGGSMMASQSPSLAHRQIMDINVLNAEFSKIPVPIMPSLRQELGIEKDPQAFTPDEKQRVLGAYRQRMRNQKPGVPPNAMAGPSTNPSMPPRNTGRPPKRNSSSPGDEQEPPGAGSSPKRIRRSPMEQHMTGMAGASYPQPPPQGQPPLPQQGGPQHLMRMGGPQHPPQGSFNMMNPMGGPMMNPPMGGGPLSPAMVPNQAGLIAQQPIQMMRDGQYRAVQMHGGRPMMPPQQPGMMPNPMSNAASPAADPNFPGGPPFNAAGGPPPPGPGAPNSRPQQPPQQQGPPGGKPAMNMLPPPPPSPGMQKDKDVKVEGSPRNNPMATDGTQTAPGTAPPTPVTANPPPPPTTMDPSALLSMNPADMFTSDFITNVASGLDVDFNPGGMFGNPTGDMGDINFERDFGQWFDPTDALAPLDMTK